MKKKIMYRTVFLIALIAFHWPAKAQFPRIDSLRIIPFSSLATDNIKVISDATFGTGECRLTSAKVNAAGGTIEVFAWHLPGMLTVICHSRDTVALGKFNAGSYLLIYHLSDSAGKVIYDTDSLRFQVKNSVGISDVLEKGKTMIALNPLNGRLMVNLDDAAGEYEIVVGDMYGREMKRWTCFEDGICEMPGERLASGIYMVRVIKDHIPVAAGKVFAE